MSNAPCVICEGRETIENLVWLQYQGSPERHPVCAAHYPQLEECWRETQKIRTPPVVIHLSGLQVGAMPHQ